MEAVLACDAELLIVDDLPRELRELPGDVGVELRVVRVRPGLGRALPWDRQVILDVDQPRELIEGQALQLRRVLEDPGAVEHRLLEHTLRAADEGLAPGVRIRIVLEVSVDFFMAFPVHQRPDFLILGRELLHRPVAWQLRDWRVCCHVLVFVQEFVQPYQVEGVAELAACRVGAVV